MQLLVIEEAVIEKQLPLLLYDGCNLAEKITENTQQTPGVHKLEKTKSQPKAQLQSLKDEENPRVESRRSKTDQEPKTKSKNTKIDRSIRAAEDEDRDQA
ncbi:hypothetical protein ACFX13_041008 [Malus domestica]